MFAFLAQTELFNILVVICVAICIHEKLQISESFEVIIIGATFLSNRRYFMFNLCCDSLKF